MSRRTPGDTAVSPQTPEWPAGGGEMAALIRAHDWAATPLGPIATWPQSLRTAVDTALACAFPMIVLWGPDLVQIYNDGNRALMGGKHPAGLGQPTRACWPEVWHINAPIYERVWAGETLTFADALYPITRHGQLEDPWFTLCYSPLRSEDGGVAGVLVTVFETTAHILSAQQRDAAEAELRANEARLRRALEIETVGVIFFKTTGAITHANEAFLRMSGYTSADRENGLVRWDAMTPPEYMPASLKAVQEFETLGRTTPYEKEYIRKDGSRWWALFAATRIDADTGVEYIIDITERKQAELALREAHATLERRVAERTADLATALAEQQALLREVNHRVKNNLAVIDSLLSLQAADVEDARAQQGLIEAANRVRTIAVVHRLLYAAPSQAHVDVGRFAAELAQALFTSYGVTGGRVRFALSGAWCGMELEQAVPLGLIFNELFTNALKYAFPDGRTGCIEVRLDETGSALEVADDGVGLPVAVDPAHPHSLGLQLVQGLVGQLGGTFQVLSGPGTRYRLQFPPRSGR